MIFAYKTSGFRKFIEIHMKFMNIIPQNNPKDLRVSNIAQNAINRLIPKIFEDNWLVVS